MCCIYPPKYILSEILCAIAWNAHCINTQDSLVVESSMQSKKDPLPSSACSLDGGYMVCSLSGTHVMLWLSPSCTAGNVI